MPDGLRLRVNSIGVPILGIHWSAHPERTEEWRASEQPKYSEGMWRQEYELDDNAMSGERVVGDLLERRWKEIVITDPGWEADPHWKYGAGLDYGKTHPTSWHCYGIDFESCRYALAEHYRSGNEWTPKVHTHAIRGMRARFLKNAPLALSLPRSTVCDPSMSFANMAQAEKFTSILELFKDAGFPHISCGIRGGDQAFVDKIREAWSGPAIKFKILCRGVPFPLDPGSMRKREGTYEQGCPNLLWELLHLRRRENSAARVETVGESEALVDKDNDAFDDLKYWWNSSALAPQQSREVEWQEKVRQFEEQNNGGDGVGRMTSLVLMRQKWEAQQRQVHTWK